MTEHPSKIVRTMSPLSWDEALDRIVAGMGRPEAAGIWPGHGTFTTNYGTAL